TCLAQALRHRRLVLVRHSMLSLLSIPLRRPRPPLFPYTTLFRSTVSERRRIVRAVRGVRGEVELEARIAPRFDYGRRSHRVHVRSEEHTSELQSREKLVCRLQLEKKNAVLL